LIDDMEHDRTALDTYRVFSTDSGLDHSALMFQRIARPGGGHMLALQAKMAEKAKPWTQLWIPLTRGAVEPMDASKFQTLQLDIRGEGPVRVLFDRHSLRGYAFPAQTVEAAPEWRTVSVPLPTNPTDLNAIGIELARPPGQPAWLELDNLRFQ
jgi:hypothetical protein